MLIDCDDCALRDLACDDCVVTVLLGGTGAGLEPDDGERRALEVDDGERRALEVLADSGLVPHLRLVPVGPPGRPAPRSAAS